MRYGVLADIHANLGALRAALRLLDDLHVDRILCLGDLVGYGPHPNECVRLVSDRNVLCVAGNHDLIAAGRISGRRAGMLARQSLAWTRSELEDDVRRRLEDLPVRAEPEDWVVMAHGSLDDPEEYVRVEGAPAELRRLGADPQRARLLLLGHTHHPLAYASRSGRLPLKRGLRTQMPRDELVLANPGSVGQSRRWSPWGTLLVLDTSRWQLELHTVRYDPRPVRRSLRSRGLPRGSLYRPPFAPRAALRRWRRA